MRMRSNARAVALRLASASELMDKAVQTTITHHAALLETRVKRHASGRPGPNVRTGDYRRSITRTKIDNGWAVGTNAAQGRRLEFGFAGTDSAGRTFDQPPFPHFGPALDEQEPLLIEDVQRALGRSLR